MKWKRPLFLAHRWAGILLCVFFVLWFLSGIFMMYVEFPQLTRNEKLAALPRLDFSAAKLTPGQAVARLRAGDFGLIGAPDRNRPNSVEQPAAALSEIDSLRLTMLLRRPLYLIQPEGPAQPRAVWADSGEILPAVSAELALRIATDFAQRFLPGQPLAPRYIEQLQTDQWSLSSALNAHRPLHLIALGDAAGTRLYVSSTTGEVVRDSHRRERVLNYFGAVTHWLYPTVIRRHPDAWAWMVDLLAGFGTALALSGIWIGLLRWKRRPKPGKSSIPYRGLMRWHHISGLAFGLFALTWVFSGWLSMNPGDLNPPREPSPAEQLVYAGKPLTPSDFALPAFSPPQDAVEAELLHYAARPWYFATLRDNRRQLFAASPSQDGQTPSVEAMLALAPELMPRARLLRSRVLQDYDDYYYARNRQNGSRPLPVIRVEFDDAQDTWFHLDPRSGQVIERSTRINRLYRWLYNGLHSWDLRWLWERRPLWDLAVIGFSLGGLSLSLIGVVAGVRRLRTELGLAPRSRHRR